MAGISGERRLQALPHARLMRESEAHVEVTARTGDAEQRLITGRLLAEPRAYLRWEAEHSRLMLKVADHRRVPQQALELRATSLALIHRKALFEYLRDRRVTGAARHQVLELFYGMRDYATSVIAEHGHYLRSASSGYCSCHLGGVLLRDPAFDAAITRYEVRYTDYFRVFCDAALIERGAMPPGRTLAGTEASRVLPVYLKEQLRYVRGQILRMPLPKPRAAHHILARAS